jgi:hypothetical protein
MSAPHSTRRRRGLRLTLLLAATALPVAVAAGPAHAGTRSCTGEGACTAGLTDSSTSTETTGTAVTRTTVASTATTVTYKAADPTQVTISSTRGQVTATLAGTEPGAAYQADLIHRIRFVGAAPVSTRFLPGTWTVDADGIHREISAGTVRDGFGSLGAGASNVRVTLSAAPVAIVSSARAVVHYPDLDVTVTAQDRVGL